MIRCIKIRQSEIEARERHEEATIDKMLDKARALKSSGYPDQVAEGVELEREALHEYGVHVIGVETNHSASCGQWGELDKRYAT